MLLQSVRDQLEDARCGKWSNYATWSLATWYENNHEVLDYYTARAERSIDLLGGDIEYAKKDLAIVIKTDIIHRYQAGHGIFDYLDFPREMFKMASGEVKWEEIAGAIVDKFLQDYPQAMLAYTG